MASLTNINSIVLLDKSVRPNMKSNIADLIKYGIILIEDIKEIKSSDLIKTNKVVILGKYNYKSLWELKLYKQILNLDLYLITDDPLLKYLLKDFCKVYDLDYTLINSNLLYSVIYNDEGEQLKFQFPEDRPTMEEEVERVLEVTSDEKTQYILEDYIRLRDILKELSDINKNLSKEVLDNNLEINGLKDELSVLTKSYDNLVKQVLEQRKVLKDAKIAFDMEYYEKINTSEYLNRPKILYFKEYQPMNYEESFIDTLMDMFRQQGNMSCKLVRLHDKYDLVRIKCLEEKYSLVNSVFRESDVIRADKILSYGNYKKLLDFLLTNKTNLDLLIIYDCKKLDSLVLRDNIIYFNLCHNEEIAKYLGLKEGNTICNNATEYPLTWDTLVEYDRFKNQDDKFRLLASSTVMTRIYKSVKPN